MLNGPTKNLNWSELKCKDGTDYPKEFIKDGRVFRLARAFELIREACGDKPIYINSAYRTTAYNKSVGGARNSQHLHGRALDLKCPKGWSIDDFYGIIKEVARSYGLIKGIGKYNTFVHIDIRPQDRISYWFGNGVKDSQSTIK